MDAQWYYSHDGETHGPFSEEEIEDRAAKKMLLEGDLIWPKGKNQRLDKGARLTFQAAVVQLVNTRECGVAAIESVWWDLDEEPEGNVRHIAEHDLTKEEVEEVLGNPANPSDESHSSGRPATFFASPFPNSVWERRL